MKKLLCGVLAALILVTQISAAPGRAAGAPAVTAFRVNLTSSETAAKTAMLYQSDGAYYLDLNDVLTYTRASATEDQSGLKLKQGSRSIKIDKAVGTLSEENVESNAPLHLIKTDGKTLVPAYAMLTYLGASCEFLNNTLLVSMPAYTVWEAIDFPIEDYALSAEELWGDDLNAELTCDIIMQMLYGVGLFGSLDEVLENAMDDVLGTDPYQYDACIGETRNYLSRLDQLDRRLHPSQDGSLATQALESVFSSAHDALDFTSNFLGVSSQIVDSDTAKLINGRNFEAIDASSVLGSAGFKSLSAKIGDWPDAAEAAAGLMNLATTVVNRMNYTQDAVDSLSAFTASFPSSLGDYQTNLNYQVASKLDKTLSGKKSVIVNSAAEKTMRAIANKAGDQGIGLILEQLGSAKMIYGAFKIGEFVESLLPGTQAFVKQSDADLKAILLTDLLTDTGACLNRQGRQIIDSRYKDGNQIENYRRLCEFWVKTAMAANEKLIAVVENGGNQTYLPSLKQRNQDLSVILFKLSNTKGQAIPDFQALSASKALDQSIVSGMTPAASDIDSATEEKIRDYLRDIAVPEQGSMPPFDQIARIDNAWVVSGLWYRTPDDHSQYQSSDERPYMSISLSAIEKEAKRLINPDLSLSPDADYSDFSTITRSHPQWVPSQKLFIWLPTDGQGLQWDYPITSAVRDGDQYRVACAETYYISSADELSSGPHGVLFCNGQRVGTEKDGIDVNSPPVFHYTTDPSKLPQLGFVLRDNGSGGFSVVSKSGVQSKVEFPEEEPSSESKSEAALSQRLQHNWVEGDGSVDGGYDNYITFKSDGTCSFIHHERIPVEGKSLAEGWNADGEYSGKYTMQGENTILFEGSFRDVSQTPYYKGAHPKCKFTFQVAFIPKEKSKTTAIDASKTKCLQITLISGKSPFELIQGESWKANESREFWS